MSYYLHNIPGRIRAKTPLLKGNGKRAAIVQQNLSSVSGIKDCVVSTVTGSITITYDVGTISRAEVLSILNRECFFDISKAVSNDEYLHNAASKAGTVLSKIIFGAVIEQTLAGSALSIIGALI